LNSSERIASAREHAAKDGAVLYNAAVVAELDHRRKDAIAALRSALENGYSLNLIERAPELASLRSDPAWMALVARMKEQK